MRTGRYRFPVALNIRWRGGGEIREIMGNLGRAGYLACLPLVIVVAASVAAVDSSTDAESLREESCTQRGLHKRAAERLILADLGKL